MRYYYPSTVSLEDHAEDDSVGASDIDSVEGDLNSGYILSTLSGDQRWVASLLSQGFGRTEIATALALPVVTVHKIVLGIKLKLAPHYTSSITKRERNFYQNIILLFLFSAPSATPEIIETTWNTHPVLREYKKPDKYLIKQWYNSIVDAVLLTRGGEKTMDDTKPTDTDEPKTPVEGSEDAGDDDKDESSKEDSGN